MNDTYHVEISPRLDAAIQWLERLLAGYYTPQEVLPGVIRLLRATQEIACNPNGAGVGSDVPEREEPK